ncbi:unnamed protein product [Closterium sp. Naga37s-1]|nr:unnamed protein product [Closterium sp. Naga37s-1]
MQRHLIHHSTLIVPSLPSHIFVPTISLPLPSVPQQPPRLLAAPRRRRPPQRQQQRRRLSSPPLGLPVLSHNLLASSLHRGGDGRHSDSSSGAASPPRPKAYRLDLVSIAPPPHPDPPTFASNALAASSSPFDSPFDEPPFQATAAPGLSAGAAAPYAFNSSYQQP